MIKRISFSKDNQFQQDLLKILNDDGVCIIDGALDTELLDLIKTEVEEEISQLGENYNFGISYRSPFSRHESLNNSISRFFSQGWMEKIFSTYTGIKDKKNPNDIFATHDFIQTDDLARNGFLHFDRLHCIKFFLYLTDVDEASGAFCCAPTTHKIGKKLRKESWSEDGEYDVIKNRLELDHPEILEEIKIVPVEGKAGTLILFDTDAFHKGGITKDNKERLIVRSHWKTKL